MTAAYLALHGFVKSPLIPQTWRRIMGRFDGPKWAPAIISGLALGVLLLQQGFGANGLFHDQAKDVQSVQSQVAVLQKQQDGMGNQINAIQAQMATLIQLPALIQRLNDRLDASPRADMLNSQFNEMQKHLSSLDGRSDANETRLRVDEERMIRDATRLDQIENASKAALGNNRR